MQGSIAQTWKSEILKVSIFTSLHGFDSSIHAYILPL